MRRAFAPAAFLFLSFGPIRAEETAALPDDTYVYTGDQHRDPFVPLTGAAGVVMTPTAVKSDASQFNLSGMSLKGILKTPTGRWAVLRGNSGEMFMVQNGKILDSRRKAVDGYVGIVKEKSLVVIGPNNQVVEVKLKRDEEKAKKQTEDERQ